MRIRFFLDLMQKKNRFGYKFLQLQYFSPYIKIGDKSKTVKF